MIPILKIRQRWLRRIVMVLLLPVTVPEYIYLGLRSLVVAWPFCWNYQHPENENEPRNED